MKNLAVVLLFVLLTAVMTYPLALHVTTAIAGPAWDGFIHLYELHWFKRAIFDLHISPLVNPETFYPFGYNLALSHITLSSTLPMMPVVLLAGPIVGFNTAVGLSFVLSGLGAYLLVVQLSGNRWAGILAGVLFAFSPYRFHNLGAGWLPNLGTQWLPFCLLYLDKLVAIGATPAVTHGRTLRWGALAGFFLALLCLSSWYHVYIGGLAVVVYVLVRGWPWRRVLASRRVVSGLAASLAVAGAMVMPLASPLARYGAAEGDITWPLIRADDASASLDDLVLPSTYHPFWGDLSRSRRAYVPALNVPGLVYVGLPALALAVYGLRRRRDTSSVDGGPRSPAAAFWVLGLTAAVLTLGLTLHVNGQRVYVPVPRGIEEVFSRAMLTLAGKLALNPGSYSPFRAEGGIPVPLPGMVLYLFAPFGSTLRVFNRFGLDTSLAFAVLAGLGAASLVARTAGASSLSPWESPKGKAPKGAAAGLRARAAAFLLIAIALLDFAAVPLPYGLSDARGLETDHWLKSQPGDFAVMHFPIARALNGPGLYRAAVHGKKIAYGYGTFFPRAWREAGSILGGFPSVESVQLLRSWNVRFVFVGQGAYEAGLIDTPGDTWAKVEARLAATPGLRYVRTFDEASPSIGDRLSAKLQQPLPIVPVVADRTHVYEIVPP